MLASAEAQLEPAKLPSRLLSMLIVGLIRFYQYVISPLLGPRCRFWPSCSYYAIDAVRLHGPLRGTWLASKRILKCHPWHPGGIDPVPSRCNCDENSDGPSRRASNRHAQ